MRVDGPLHGALEDGLHLRPLAAEGVHQCGDVALPRRDVVVEGHGGCPAAQAGQRRHHLDRGAVDDELRHPVDTRPAAHARCLPGGLVALARGLGVDDHCCPLHRLPQLAGRQLDVLALLAQDGVEDQRGVRRCQVADLAEHGQRVTHADAAVAQRLHEPRLRQQGECGADAAERRVRADVKHAGDLARDELPLARLRGLDHPPDGPALADEGGRLLPRRRAQRAGQRRRRGEQEVSHTADARPHV